MSELNNKVAIITGGGSGIGRAISELFAQEGAHVHIVDLNADVAQLVVDQIISGGGQAKLHTCHVAQEAEVKRIIDSSGRIDILVNNGGMEHEGNLDICSSDDFERMINVNIIEG